MIEKLDSGFRVRGRGSGPGMTNSCYAVAIQSRVPSPESRSRPLIPRPLFVHIYLDLLRDVLEHGARKDDRTGTGTFSVFGRQIRMDLGAGFPLLTTKKLHIRSIVHELLWFLRGDTNTAYLKEHGVSI